MAKHLKNIRFWLAIVFGTSFGLLFDHYVLFRLWSLESLRFQIAAYLSVAFFSIICFWGLELILVPRFRGLDKAGRLGVILLSAFLLPMILIVSALNFEKLLNQDIYFLLPVHSVEIQALPDNERAEVALTAFFTEAQGHISFDTLELKGWERVGDRLVLTDLESNQIKWRGKTGEKAFLVFRSSQAAPRIMVSWDNAQPDDARSSNQSGEIRLAKQFSVPFYADWSALLLMIYLCTAAGSFAVSLLFAIFPGLPAGSALQKRVWLVHALPMYGVWAIYLLTFWPGFMSADSIVQWEQVVTGNFVHAHPVGHTLTLWLITRFWFSPAAVALVQITALGAVLGWGIATLRESGAPAWLAWLTTIALAISPANSTLSITLWKDVLFSVAVVALTIIVFKIVATEGKWLDQKRSWAVLGITLTLVNLYRLNGILVAAGILLLIAWIYRQYWQSLLKSAVLFLGIYLLFTGIIFRILDVRVPDMARDELVTAQLLASHIQAGLTLSQEEQALLKPAFPQYPWPYRCYRNAQLIFTLDRAYLIEHSSDISEIALRATRQNPLQTLRHFACQGASVYRIPQEYPNEMVWFGVVNNNYGIKPASKLPGLTPLLTELLKWLTDRRGWSVVQFVWRMPFWMYLGIFSCVVFCIRNKTWRPLLVLIPGLVTVLPYLILTLGQIFRYVYSMYLVGILFSGYFLLCVFSKDTLLSAKKATDPIA